MATTKNVSLVRRNVSFTNASWNSHENAGILKCGLETKFTHTNTPPKFKKIVFIYCISNPCNKNTEKIIVRWGTLGGDDSGSNSGAATNDSPQAEGPTTNPTTANPDATTEEAISNGQCSTKLTNYKNVLHKSLMFYEAQRSGKIPADNRIPFHRHETPH